MIQIKSYFNQMKSKNNCLHRQQKIDSFFFAVHLRSLFVWRPRPKTSLRRARCYSYLVALYSMRLLATCWCQLELLPFSPNYGQMLNLS